MTNIGSCQFITKSLTGIVTRHGCRRNRSERRSLRPVAPTIAPCKRCYGYNNSDSALVYALFFRWWLELKGVFYRKRVSETWANVLRLHEFYSVLETCRPSLVSEKKLAQESTKACCRKVRLSQKTARQRRQSHFSVTVWTGLDELSRNLYKFLAQDFWACVTAIIETRFLTGVTVEIVTE